MINNILNTIVLADFNLEKAILLWRTPTSDSFFYLVTFLGHWVVILILTSVVVFLFKKYRETFLIRPLLVSVCGSAALTLVVKALVGRARPVGDIPLYVEKLSSFPSAHAALTFALFGFLTYCVWRFGWPTFAKIVLTLVFILTILIVGFSRLYLGVHFLSDVIGGYLVGLLWVLIALYLSKRQ